MKFPGAVTETSGLNPRNPRVARASAGRYELFSLAGARPVMKVSTAQILGPFISSWTLCRRDAPAEGGWPNAAECSTSVRVTASGKFGLRVRRYRSAKSKSRFLRPCRIQGSLRVAGRLHRHLIAHQFQEPLCHNPWRVISFGPAFSLDANALKDLRLVV
jgi:hypothetical protein